MKKKISLLLVICIAFVSLALILSACDTEDAESEDAITTTTTVTTTTAQQPPAPQSPIDPQSTKGLQYTPIGNDEYSVSVGTAKDVEHIVISSTYNGKPVTSIADSAFENCDKLVSIAIPSSVSVIGEEAFSGCDTIASITIPSSVISVGKEAFKYCNLEEVIFAENSRLESIGDQAFYACASLEGVIIPASVNSIGKMAFSYCDSLESVSFGNPDGWWYSSSETATDGTQIPSWELTDPSLSLLHIRMDYVNYYWKRS